MEFRGSGRVLDCSENSDPANHFIPVDASGRCLSRFFSEASPTVIKLVCVRRDRNAAACMQPDVVMVNFFSGVGGKVFYCDLPPL